MRIKNDRKIDEYISLALPSFDASRMLKMFAQFISNIAYETDYTIFQCDIHINCETKPCTIITEYDGDNSYHITIMSYDVPLLLISNNASRDVRENWSYPKLIAVSDDTNVKEYINSAKYYMTSDSIESYVVTLENLTDELHRILCFNYLTYSPLNSSGATYVAENADERIYGTVVPIYYEQEEMYHND